MNNEQLVKMAETIGWTEVYVLESMEPLVIGYPPNWKTEDVFDPYNNPAQREEIEEWLIKHSAFSSIQIFWVEEDDRWAIEYIKEYSADNIMNTGATKTEALLNTMKEVIK